MELPAMAALFGLATAVGIGQKSWLAGVAVLVGLPLGLWLFFAGWEALALCLILLRAHRLRGSLAGAELLRDSAYRVRETGWLAGPAAKSLVASLDAQEPRVRFIAAQGLCRLKRHPDLATPVLIESLPNKELRGDALGCLCDLGSAAAAAIPALMRLLPDRRDPNWWKVASALGAIGPAASDAVPALIEALEASGVDEITSPARALGEIGDPRAIPALEKLAKEGRDERARDCATRALAQLRK